MAIIDPFSNVRNLDNRPFRIIESVLSVLSAPTDTKYTINGFSYSPVKFHIKTKIFRPRCLSPVLCLALGGSGGAETSNKYSKQYREALYLQAKQTKFQILNTFRRQKKSQFTENNFCPRKSGSTLSFLLSFQSECKFTWIC